jgi:hypothetical protein
MPTIERKTAGQSKISVPFKDTDHFDSLNAAIRACRKLNPNATWPAIAKYLTGIYGSPVSPQRCYNGYHAKKRS